VARARLAVGLEGARLAGRRTLGLRPRCGLVCRPRAKRSERVEERPVGRLRRVREAPVEGREQDRRAPLGQRKAVAPEPERQAEREVGGQHWVRSLAGKVRSRCRDADHCDVEGRLQRRRARIDPAEEGLDVRDRRRPSENRRRGQLARDRGEHPVPDRPGRGAEKEADGRGGDAFECPRVVRVAVKRPGQPGRVKRERCGDHGHPAGQLPLERAGHAPARRSGGLEQRVRARRPDRLGPRRGQQGCRPAVQQRLGRRDDDDRVCFHERAIGTERERPLVP
jgi:hypothetical protein